MENFKDHSFEPKKNIFGNESLEVKYHDFTLEEAEWYLGERPYDVLDHQISNAVLAIKSYIKEGKIIVPEDIGSKEADKVYKQVRKLLKEEESNTYFEGFDSPLQIRMAAMGRALEAKSEDGQENEYQRLSDLHDKRFGLKGSGGDEEDGFIAMAIMSLGLSDAEAF